jgi:hypothetical protein
MRDTALGVLTVLATNKPAGSSFGKGVSQTIKIAVSLWPIVFAAMVSQALRAYASWKVGSGLRLSVCFMLYRESTLSLYTAGLKN